MKLAQKALVYYRNEGLQRTLARIFQKMAESILLTPVILKERFCRKKYLGEITSLTSGKRVFVIIPCIDWNIPLFQRPHQIAVELSSRENTQVLFVSDQYRYDRFPGCQKVKDNLMLVSWRFAASMDTALGRAAEIVVIMSWMRHAHLLEKLHYDRLVYEYIDDLSLFYYHSPEMEEIHCRLIKEADLTTCTARALYKDALPHARHAILSPNAGDYAFFHNNRDVPVHPMLKERLQGYSCVIGYYGSLANWFDYDLIFQVAIERPDWCFVLVGHSFDGTAERLKKECRKNIIHIPAQPYQSLPAFIAACDILCIPFCINKVTTATSPVKLFEYMASGKPILSAMLPECMGYLSVFTYRDAEDFEQKVPKLLDARFDEGYLSLLDKEAQENTWEARVTDILQQLDVQASEQERKHE